MIEALPFPNIDPILFQIGPIAIRWYGLAYVAGLVLAWRYVRALADQRPKTLKARDVDDFLVWATLGVILGGRLGYVVFYNAGYFLENPFAVFETWKGGMSFHGGLLGVITATLLFCRKRKIPVLELGDMVAAAAPIGLLFGRAANFINGELFGRTTDVPWAMVFPHGGPVPRHPTQIYEALLEGVVLFAVLFVLARREEIRKRPGILIGVFLVGYGVARISVEFFRQPDAHIGLLLGGSTMGQWLSVPMLLIGVIFILRARPKAVPARTLGTRHGTA